MDNNLKLIPVYIPYIIFLIVLILISNTIDNPEQLLRFQKVILVLFVLIGLIRINYYNNLKYPIDHLETIETIDKPIVYYFYAEWCPHCKNFFPEWKKFVERIQNQKLDLEFQLINECNEKQLCKQYNITGFPTVILKINGLLNNHHLYQTVLKI